MNVHYTKSPSDYADALRNKGQRKKARAFWEYCYDIENKEFNSIGFYAKSWGVSKSTAYTWVVEFKHQYDLFNDALSLKNAQQNSHVKKHAERLPNGNETNNIDGSPIKSAVVEMNKTLNERLPNKALNINDDDAGARMRMDRMLFEDLYRIYRRLNNKKAGRIDDAWKEYMEIGEEIEYSSLKKTIILYLHDREIKKRYNFANFMHNKIYLDYMSKKMRVLIGDEWIVGEYDDERGVFTSDAGKEWRLTPEKLADKLGRGELHFEVGEAAA